MGDIKYREGMEILGKWLRLVTWVLVAATVASAVSSLESNPHEVLILLAILCFLMLLIFLFGRMTTTVGTHTLTVAFGSAGLIQCSIPLSAVQEAKVLACRPLREFGGWGIRSGKIEGETAGCLTAAGDRGVLLTLSAERRVCLVKTRKVLIGSKTPEDLLNALGR